MTTFSRAPHVYDCDLPESSVIFHGELLEYFNVKGSAKAIWGALQTPQSVDSIVEKLLPLYEVDRQVCEDSVRTFLESLIAAKLVSVSEELPEKA